MSNPLLHPSPLPYGLPPFDAIATGYFAPAFEAGMAEQLAEIAAITGSASTATFTDTVEALERCGQTLARVRSAFRALLGSTADAQLRELETEYRPRLAAHDDAIMLDRALFARLDTVHRSRHDAGLSAEQLYLVERLHRDFVLAGAGLDDAGAAELRRLNRLIAESASAFDQRLQAAMEDAALVVAAHELDGLGEAAVAAAALAAHERGHDAEQCVLPLVLPTEQPALALLTDRDVRRRLFEASVNRARHGEHDTRPLVIDLVQLRARKAELLGFATYAELAVADATAPSAKAVDDFLAELVAPTMTNLAVEADALAHAAAADGLELAPYDWTFYAERVRAERFDLDAEALRPYFELDRVVTDGVFFAAHRLYGLSFVARPDLRGYCDDVRVWEVFDGEPGEPDAGLGLFAADYYARPGKRGGAWMQPLVPSSHLLGARSVVLNNLNIVKPAAGEPTLLTLDEVRTTFHEFGHALHALLSDTTYPTGSGTDVPTDFVEYPSQVNEIWMLEPTVLANYARHVDTGAPLPPGTAAAIDAAAMAGQGFETLERLAASLLDRAWHRVGADEVVDDPDAFEAAALAAAGVANDLVPPRYRTSYFRHAFGNNYSARYYSYLWSEILDADTAAWFAANGGLTRANGERFRRTVLGVGGSADPIAAVSALLGHEPQVEPLLVRRGLLPA